MPPCPCGSGEPFESCCGPLLGGEPAPTAERLMRSRYTAYTRGDAGYLSATWAPETRPKALDLADGPEWLGLAILRAAGGAGDEAGTVEFRARYRAGGREEVLHETSRFRRDQGRWVYVDGQLHDPPAPTRVGRNALCPCGSGRKYKRCCGKPDSAR